MEQPNSERSQMATDLAIAILMVEVSRIDHVSCIIAMIRVPAAGTKKGINNKVAPGHLKRMKAIDIFIGILNAMTLFGFIVIHDHAVKAEFNGIR